MQAYNASHVINNTFFIIFVYLFFVLSALFILTMQRYCDYSVKSMISVTELLLLHLFVYYYFITLAFVYGFFSNFAVKIQKIRKV